MLDKAAALLVAQVAAMRRRLDFADAPLAFAGGLLDTDNYYSLAVAAALDLVERPVAKYPPVIGAALLAKLEWSANESK